MALSTLSSAHNPAPRRDTSPGAASQGIATNRRPSFQMSADARLLYARLSKVTVGESITYQELSDVVSRKVDGSFGPLSTARKHCRRERQMVFDTIYRVGLKCLSDEEKVKTADRVAARLRKTARRGIEGLSMVQNFQGLPGESQAKHNAALSIFSVVGALTTNSSMRKIEEVVTKARKELPMTETLKALGLAQ